jgi:deoxycytidine triphosphate deaminase
MAGKPSSSSPTTTDDLAERRAGVLSDTDIRAEIDARVLISNHRDSSIQPSCYDLRVGHVIGKRIGVVDGGASGIKAVKLRPGELATLLSKERVKLPSNVTGLVIPRNEYAERGILILNAGHVDPGYEGHVMAQLVNLSDRDQSIRIGESVFSVVFDYLHTRAECPRDNPSKATGERVAELEERAIEKADTLAISVGVLQDRFVSQDSFTRLLLARIAGFLAIVAIVVAVWTQIAVLTDSTIATEWNWRVFGPASIAVLGGVLAAFSVRAMVVWVGHLMNRHFFKKPIPIPWPGSNKQQSGPKR